MPALAVWMNGVAVGIWTHTRAGSPAFVYDASWVASPAARALSLSLPLTASREIRGAVVNDYFDNLLPDSAAIRTRLVTRFKARSTHAFDLLGEIGRDCVGAVQLLAEGQSPAGWDRVDADPLSTADLERHLRAATASVPLGADSPDDDFRISIAGAQEKTALLRMGGRWYRPGGATPTTHILKLPLGPVGNLRVDLSQSVENEWLCAQIVREFGLPIANTDMASFGSQRVLVVERFDRRWQGVDAQAVARRGFSPPAGAWIARLPQEDFCQALGQPSRLKYQSDGGPGVADGLKLLAASEHAADDRAGFLKAQFVFWLLAATDGHAKNFSVHHHRGGVFGMTPLYDVISAWPIIGNGARQLAYQRARLAMGVRGISTHYRLGEVRARHWQWLAERHGLQAVWGELVALAATVDDSLQRVQRQLPPDFPESVWLAIKNGVQRHAAQFLREVEGAA